MNKIENELLYACIEAESVLDWLDKNNGEILDESNIKYVHKLLKNAIKLARKG